MSDFHPSVFQEIINTLSKIKHSPQEASSLYSSASQKLNDTYGTADICDLIVGTIKTESHDLINTFLTQLEYSDIGVLSLVQSPSLVALLSAIIDTKNVKMLSTILDILLKSSTLSDNCIPVQPSEIITVFEKFVPLISLEDLTISDKVCKLTELIISTSSSYRNLLNLMNNESMKYIVNEKSVYLRFANIWARILGKSDILFNACVDCGAAGAIISLCQSSSDILAQIVSIELLTEFAKTSAGFLYLLNQDIIRWLVSLSSKESPYADLLGNQSVRQLADCFAIASSKGLMADEIWRSLDKELICRYIETVKGYLDNRNDSDRLAGIYAITNFSSSCIGALSATMTDETLIENWFHLMNSGKIEILESVLYSINRIIDMKIMNHGNEEVMINEIDLNEKEGFKGIEEYKEDLIPEISNAKILVNYKKRVISEIGKAKNTMAVSYLIKTARQPVPELKGASHELLNSICKQQPGGWGLHALYSTPGFREYLLDRNTEHSKEGKETKFRLILTVSECPEFRSLMSESTCKEVDAMIDQGAYYRPIQVEEPMTMEH